MSRFPVGTYEDALPLIGTMTKTTRAEVRVERGFVRAFASHLEDGRDAYWTDRDDGLAPPGILLSLFMHLPWKPGQPAPKTSTLAAMVPLPQASVLAVSTETTFHRQLRVGDLLTAHSGIEGISPLKQTRIGVGHFVTERTVYRDEVDEAVAENLTTVFRFDAVEEASS